LSCSMFHSPPSLMVDFFSSTFFSSYICFFFYLLVSWFC
jgi:hypothetical protein